ALDAGAGRAYADVCGARLARRPAAPAARQRPFPQRPALYQRAAGAEARDPAAPPRLIHLIAARPRPALRSTPFYRVDTSLLAYKSGGNGRREERADGRQGS